MFILKTFPYTLFQHTFIVRGLEQENSALAICLQAFCNLSAFYRTMLLLCIRGTSHEPVSVRLSVRHKSVFYRIG